MFELLTRSAPRNETRSFQFLRQHTSQYIKMIALAGVAGAALACGPAHANEIAPKPAPAATADAQTCSGRVWWSELLAPETEKLTDFYAKVMDWKVKVVDAEDPSEQPKSPEDRYSMFLNGEDQVAGLMKASHPAAAHSGLGWFTYMQVADVEATAKKVVENGGTVLRQPVETESGDYIAVVRDPMGNVFGIVTPAENDC